ncbi:ribonuclease S-4 isoform X1 [Capsicum galapagoense]
MKMKNLSLFLVTLTLFFISVCSQNVAQTQFVYRWPETYCNKDTKTTVKCNKIPPLQFTLVEFWGLDSNGKLLENCKDTAPKDWDKTVFTTQVVTQLTAFWPSLTRRDPKEKWREAWKTYGTCLVTPKLKGPTQYFNRAIRLSDEIGNLLEKHLIQSDGIVPCDSATYTNVEILNSLKTVTTVNNQNEKEVSFTCADINETHAYLNQVTFCYNKDAKDFEDCPTSNRCRVENIIVPRPSPPTTRPSSLQYMLSSNFQLFKLEKSFNK